MIDYHRIYVAGPYTAFTRLEIERNVRTAIGIASECMSLGHDAYCPHAASNKIDLYGKMMQEDYMRVDLGIIRYWATALYLIAHSPVADRELKLARELGLPVFQSMTEVPDCRSSRLVVTGATT